MHAQIVTKGGERNEKRANWTQVIPAILHIDPNRMMNFEKWLLTRLSLSLQTSGIEDDRTYKKLYYRSR